MKAIIASTKDSIPSPWQAFFEHHPFFGSISSQISTLDSNPKKLSTQKDHQQEETQVPTKVEKAIVLQRFWRKITSTDTTVNVDSKSKKLPEQARLLANIRTDKEIKEVLLNAAQKKQLNSNHVHAILSQKNSLKCAYELYKKDKLLTEAQFFRIVDLHKKHVREEHNIRKSLNVKKIKQLRELIRNGLENLNQNNTPFQELQNLMKGPDFPELVLGLFDSNYSDGLQAQQLITLLELYQAQKKRTYLDEKGNQISSDQPNVTMIHRILDDQGNFTEDAKKYLLPSLVRNSEPVKYISVMRGINDNETYDQFKKLVSQLPASEQIFYITELPSRIGLTSNVLGEEAFSHQEIMREKKHILTVPSCGVRNAIGLLQYGVEDYVPVIPQFGVKSMTDIEKGLRIHHARLAYLYYPHTPDPGAVHGTGDDIYIGVFAHDLYHSDVVSSLPPYAKEGFDSRATS